MRTKADNDIHLVKFVFTNKIYPPGDAVRMQRTINVL